MKGVTLEVVQFGRDFVGTLIEKKQKGDRSPELLAQIADYEDRVVKLLVQYHAQPDCPFCRMGKMIVTPTQGRLGCERCNAIALVGSSKAEIVK